MKKISLNKFVEKLKRYHQICDDLIKSNRNLTNQIHEFTVFVSKLNFSFAEDQQAFCSQVDITEFLYGFANEILVNPTTPDWLYALVGIDQKFVEQSEKEKSRLNSISKEKLVFFLVNEFDCIKEFARSQLLNEKI